MNTLKKTAHLLVAISICLGIWAWAGRPQPLADLAAAKLDCVSYTPFRGSETPFDEKFVASYDNIREDLIKLKAITDCIRIYAIDQGLDQTLPLARELQMRVLMGIWIGREADKNDLQIDTAISLAKKYADVIRAIIVGNEVLLRGEQRPERLAEMIERVKSETGLPVTYADVWEYWLRAPELADKVDFLTIHILPYWEDDPIPASEGLPHFQKILAHVKQAFPGKEIFIGETGYPSRGRVRENAIPSLYDQSLYLRDLIRYANEHHIGYNLIEAFDQPWKRASEGTVGGYWGLFDSERQQKFEWHGPVSNYPHWFGWGMASAAMACLILFVRGKEGWLAGIFATLLMMQIEHSITAWRNGWELAVEIYLLLQSLALIFMTPSLWGGDKKYWSITLSSSQIPALYLATLLSVGVTSLGQVFDPRYRDFPLAAFAIPALCFLFLRPKVTEDRYIRWLLLLSALYIAIAENLGNAINVTSLLWSVFVLVIVWPQPAFAKGFSLFAKVKIA